jgi:PucR family transcriptional regulator, purine catabolism regulatory protein
MEPQLTKGGQMAITVGELLQLPHLRMTLTAGAGGLDREISWVHTSDLPDPWEWLGSGELLLTNGTGLSSDESAQVAFIERLAETGASGLGIGLGMSGPPLASEVARRADELRLPLVAVPYSMPFTAVVRAVADANDREESRQLGRVARLYELLRTSVLAGRPGPEMFRKLGQELDVRLYLVDPETGRSVFGDGECTSFAAALIASYAAHGNTIPGVLRLSQDGAVPGHAGAVAVAVPGDQPTVLVAEPVGTQLPSLVLLHHIATGGALELAQLIAAQERQRRLGADLLAGLMDRRMDGRVAQPQIADLGLDLAVSVLAVTRAGPAASADLPGSNGAGLPGANGADLPGANGVDLPGRNRADLPGGTSADLHRRLDRSRVPHLLLRRDRLLYVALPEGAAEAHLLPEPSDPAWTVGISDRIAMAGRLPDAVQEARWALGAAEAEKRPLVRYGDQTALLLPRSAIEARALVSRILGPLIRADAEHGTDYVNTLRMVLEHDRSWLLASAELHIHKQTLGYRIRKIEQLTGRGLARTEHLAEWWFALRAHDLLAGRHLN